MHGTELRWWKDYSGYSLNDPIGEGRVVSFTDKSDRDFNLEISKEDGDIENLSLTAENSGQKDNFIAQLNRAGVSAKENRGGGRIYTKVKLLKKRKKWNLNMMVE